VTAEKCDVILKFQFDNHHYAVTFEADNWDYTNEFIATVERSIDKRTYFSYTIVYECNNQDDCARQFAQKKIIEMINHSFDIDDVTNDIMSLLPDTGTNTTVVCYDSEKNVDQCSNVTHRYLCQISDVITSKKISQSCTYKQSSSVFSVNMQDLRYYAKFDFDCSRSLCNNVSMLQTVKQIMFKHNIIKTIDGRLSDEWEFNKSLQLVTSYEILLYKIIGLLFTENKFLFFV
jgi:hypothetical protein